MIASLEHRYFNIRVPHRDIPCKEFYRENTAVKAVIIGLHGFGGSKESSALTLLADKMPQSFRLIALDFPGHGASDGSPLTVESCINDVLCAVKYAENNFPHASLYIFGTSFGGYISLFAEKILYGKISKIVLRAPAVEMGKTLIEKLIDIPENDFKMSGFATVLNDKLKVSYVFYRELIGHDAFTLKPSTPTLMICATNDELVDYSAQVCYSDMNPQIKRADIIGAGHRFMGDGELEAAIDLAVNFLTTEEEV